MEQIRKKLWEVPASREKDELNHYKEFGWITEGSGEFGFDSVPNLYLRKTDKKNFAHFHEGNPADNLFYKVQLINSVWLFTSFHMNYRLINCTWKVVSNLGITASFTILCCKNLEDCQPPTIILI